MMTVAVLNPQDFLEENRFSRQTLISSPHMKFPKHANNRQPRAQSHCVKRGPQPPRRQSRAAVAGPPSKSPGKTNLVMGRVKILKRGEELTSTEPFLEKKIQTPDPDLGSTNRLGPDPVSLPTQIRLADSNNQVGVAPFYAGSAFIISPTPSCLPVPAFTMKTVSVKKEDSDVVEHDAAAATTVLRGILNLL